MGGLAITERVPAPSYEFEMVNKTTAEVIDVQTGELGEKSLFLHYRVRIPGFCGIDFTPENRVAHTRMLVLFHLYTSVA